MRFDDGRDDNLKGGAIKNPKKEEIAATVIPSAVVIREAPVQPLRTMARTIATPNLVQPELSELTVPVLIPSIPQITKRSNGKGAYYDAHDVRHHMIHSLGRHPRLLKAYLHSSVI